MIKSAPEARGLEDQDTMQPAPWLCRYRAVLRLLLFLMMLLAPDFSDSDDPSTSPEALQPAFASASM